MDMAWPVGGRNTVRISTNEESTFVHACSQGAEPQNKAL
jgi:hypothetical protein